ncbi:MAG: cation:proton antiporter regulatory subunit [Acidimicrobiales bacterium]
MASFVTQLHVVDFVDVVMHNGSLLFRLGETMLATDSALAGTSLRAAHVRDETGALVLAIRRPDGSFVTNPTPDELLLAGDVLLSVGTDDQLRALGRFAAHH